MTAESLVLSRREGAVTCITLNRPRAINALNLEMFERLIAAVRGASSDGSRAILLDGSGERGFCGGGDIKEISSGDTRGILATEYGLDLMLAESPVPVVALMDGIAMGGGIGLGGHAAHRVVTERTVMAMPETRIGIAPDVGGSLLLARAPGRLGELLAATSGTMTAAEAIALGFADALVPTGRLGDLRTALVAGEDPEAVIAGLAVPASDADEGTPLLAARSWWDPIAEEAFGGGPVDDDPLTAAVRLVRLLEDAASTAGGGAGEQSASVLRTIRQMCPMSVVVAIARVDRTRRSGPTLAEVLEEDLLTLGRLGARADFAEGVRAQVIDKDRNPRWNPGRIEDLDPAEVEAMLAPRRADEPALGL